MNESFVSAQQDGFKRASNRRAVMREWQREERNREKEEGGEEREKQRERVQSPESVVVSPSVCLACEKPHPMRAQGGRAPAMLLVF